MNSAEQLANWVALKHKGQVIKHTGEPYFNHLIMVAGLAETATLLGYEIGLCHDLLEDTATTEKELMQAFINFGYTHNQAEYIVACVVELTDMFTSLVYPALSKSERKEKEAERLVTISPGAQTVKYADLIYNINWMIQYDPKNAAEYLKKKELLLTKMVKGDSGLRQKALNLIYKGLTIVKHSQDQ